MLKRFKGLWVIAAIIEDLFFDLRTLQNPCMP